MNPYHLTIISIIFLFTSCGKSPFSSIDETDHPVNETSTLKAQLSFPKHEINIHQFWRGPCEVLEECKMLVVLTDKFQRPPSGNFTLGARLWMSSMNPPHGSYPIAIKQIAPGVFELTEIFFTMAGLWEFHFELKIDGHLVEDFLWPQEF